jgi:erythromycin esterase-like protein
VLLVAAIAYAADPLATQPAGTHEPTPEELAWLKDNAIVLRTVEAGGSLDDLEPLKTLIGDAHIVALGEGTHGTREFFQMKHRLVEFLAREMGFTIFSIEANLPEAYRLNDFVLKGMGDPKELIAGMYFWTWNTQEVLDMVEWMRKYNKSGQGRIEFTGFDMQTPDVAADIVRDFLDRVEPAYTETAVQAYSALSSAHAGDGPDSAIASGTLPVSAVAGKHIRYTGYIKTEDLTEGWAGLWLRADGPTGFLKFDDMEDRGPKGTTPWTRYEVEVDVPKEATTVAFGTRHSGYGTAWFDTLQVEIDGKPFACRGRYDFDFESGAPRGFHVSGQAYTTSADSIAAHTGQHSLRTKYTGVSRAKTPSAWAFGVATGTFPLQAAAGKHVRYSGHIKTEGVTQGWAGLWWRVDGDNRVLKSDNMVERGPRGTTDWQQYAIEMDVPANAVNINFGVLHPGDGTAWFDQLQVELDGKEYESDRFDFGFESGETKGLDTGGDGYQVTVDAGTASAGQRSLRIRHLEATEQNLQDPNAIGPAQNGDWYGLATATLPVNAAAGKRLRYSGFIKTDSISRGWAGLLLRVSGPTTLYRLDNLFDRGPQGTTPWTRYEIEADIPAVTRAIELGLVHMGDGTAWFDDLHVEIDGQPYDTQGTIDLGLESQPPKGLELRGNGYTITRDTSDTQAGAGSLCIKYTGDTQPASASKDAGNEGRENADAAQVVRLCRGVLEHLQAGRDGYASKASAKDSDWVIQNARVALQCAESRGDESGAKRDESMAANVAWILKQAPPGTKIVLWAHNGHVSCGGLGMPGKTMGVHLREKFGSDMVVLGFACNTGQYTAVARGRGLQANDLQPSEPGSAEYYFHSAGLRRAILDLRKAAADDPRSAWLTRRIDFRDIGALAMDEQFSQVNLTKAFDALIYIDETSASRRLER